MQEFLSSPTYSYGGWHQTQIHWVWRASPLKKKWPEHKIDNSHPFGAIFTPSHIYMSQQSSTQTTVTRNNNIIHVRRFEVLTIVFMKIPILLGGYTIAE